MTADLKARVLGAVQREPSLTRQAQARLAAALVVGVGALVAAQFIAFGGVRLGGRPPAYAAATSLAWVAALGVLLRVLRSPSPLGPASRTLWAVTLGSLGVPYLVGLVGNGVYPATAVAVAGDPGLLCLELGLAWSTVPLTAAVFLRRGTDPVHPVALGAALGAVAGSLSGLLVNLTCVYTSPAHVALGHVLPAALQVAVGALLGKGVVATRASLAPARTGAALGGALGGWLMLVTKLSLDSSCPLDIPPRQLLWLAASVALGALVGGTSGSLRARAPA